MTEHKHDDELWMRRKAFVEAMQARKYCMRCGCPHTGECKRDADK